MEKRDCLASFTIGLGVILAGLGAAVFCEKSEAARLRAPALGRDADEIARMPLAEYAELRRLTRDELAAEERRSRAADWFTSHGPEAPLRAWHGVLVERLPADEKTVAASATAEEGPTCHFLVDRDGRWQATERWRAQRIWRVPELESPDDWIIVRTAAPDRTIGETALLLSALLDGGRTRGALASRTLGEKPVIERRATRAQ